jgi:hypothetical protein
MKQNPSLEVWNHPQFATAMNVNQNLKYISDTPIKLLQDTTSPKESSDNDDNSNKPTQSDPVDVWFIVYVNTLLTYLDKK